MQGWGVRAIGVFVKASSKLVILVFSSMSLLITGCGDDNNGATGWNNNSSPSASDYGDESEPTPSADRGYMYYVAHHDDDQAKMGILRVNLNTANRSLLFEDSEMHSPTPSFDQSRVAFLKSGRINYLALATDSTWESEISMTFTSIVYLNDTLLVGESQSMIYMVDENSGATIMLEPGYDPTMFARDTVVYLKPSSSQDYDVIMRGIDGGSSRRLALIHNNDRPRWVSVEPSLQRFVYVLQGALGKTLYSSQVGSVTTNQISTTPHAKAHIYGPDQILYSGPDGRFYRSNYDGSILTPFWPAVDPG